MASRDKYVRRLLYFYRILPLDGFQISKLPIEQVGEAVRQLGDVDRYLRSDDTELCAIPEIQNGRIRFGKVRRDQLPQIEKRGRVEALELAQDEGLIECIHILFLPDGIVGADFNLHGPRMHQFAEYLQSKTPSIPPITFARLIHGDALAKLQRFSKIRLLEMRLDPSRAEVFVPLDAELPNALQRLESNLGAGAITLTLQVERGSQKPLTNIKERLLDVLSHSNVQDAADVLKIRAKPDSGGTVETLDLLEDELVRQVKISRKIARKPDAYAEKIFEELEAAYSQLLPEIRAAASMQVTAAHTKSRQ